MIVDSPYEIRADALSAPAGMVSGAVGALVMLGTIAITQPMTGIGVGDLLGQIGGIANVVLGSSASETARLVSGTAVHVLLGAIFGVLYSICQSQAPVRSLIVVALFYGFVLWAIPSLLFHLVFSKTLLVSSSLVYLACCVIYGLCLAIAAIWSGKHKSAEHAIVLRD